MATLFLILTAALAAVSRAQTVLTPEEILKRAQDLDTWIVEQRREFHKTPEPGFIEYKTRSRIMRFLESNNIMYK
jgi:hypothetical protein